MNDLISVPTRIGPSPSEDRPIGGGEWIHDCSKTMGLEQPVEASCLGSMSRLFSPTSPVSAPFGSNFLRLQSHSLTFVSKNTTSATPFERPRVCGVVPPCFRNPEWQLDWPRMIEWVRP